MFYKNAVTYFSMNWRSVGSYLGVFVFISGCFSLFPIPVAMYYGDSILPYVASGVPAIIFGFLLARLPRERVNLGDAMVLAAVSLIVVSAFGSVSYMLSFDRPAGELFLDAFFESVSAYTTTGFTVLYEGELDRGHADYNHAMVFSRSLRQWVGGLGIIVIFLSILAGGNISTVYLYKIGEGADRITPSVEHTARIISRICVFYTFVAFILLWLSGVPSFFSLNAALTTVSTGGIAYSSGGLHVGAFAAIVLAVFMIAGALPFTMHHALLNGNWRRVLRNAELRTMLAVIIAATLMALAGESSSLAHAREQAGATLFNVVSAVSTTGHTTTQLSQWSKLTPYTKSLYTALMVVGGSSGSTGGGVKLIRLAILAAAVVWVIKKATYPKSAVIPFKVGGHVFSEQEVAAVALYFFSYIALLVVFASTYLVWGVGLEGGNLPAIDAFFLSASAQSNASQTTTLIAVQPAAVKLALILQMIAGRLEILPLIALAGVIFAGLNKRGRK